MKYYALVDADNFYGIIKVKKHIKWCDGTSLGPFGKFSEAKAAALEYHWNIVNCAMKKVNQIKRYKKDEVYYE